MLRPRHSQEQAANSDEATAGSTILEEAPLNSFLRRCRRETLMRARAVAPNARGTEVKQVSLTFEMPRVSRRSDARNEPSLATAPASTAALRHHDVLLPGTAAPNATESIVCE
mmetsp:Transcript_47120/g.131489  ORF Transcript_47120/g.131489 Transcript_47120/m.131489 type:complete len:113 (-) Transcript_47120:37-375(-)